MRNFKNTFAAILLLFSGQLFSQKIDTIYPVWEKIAAMPADPLPSGRLCGVWNDWIVSVYGNHLYQTTDGGQSFQTETFTPVWDNGYCSIPSVLRADERWLVTVCDGQFTVTHQPNCFVYLSEDNGESWTQTGQIGHQSYNHQSEGNHVLIAGFFNIIHFSTDFGKTFQYTQLAGQLYDGTWASMYGNEVVFGRHHRGDIYFGKDDWAASQLIADTLPSKTNNCLLFSNHQMVAVSEIGSVFRSENLGKSWEAMAKLPGKIYKSAIKRMGEIIRISDSDPTINTFFSVDYGQNWIQVTPASGPIYSGQAIIGEDNYLYAPGPGGIYRADYQLIQPIPPPPDSVVVINPDSSAIVFKDSLAVFDFNFSPNPASNKTVVNFNKDFPAGSSLQVVDALGHILLEEKLPENDHTFQLELPVNVSGPVWIWVELPGLGRRAKLLFVR